MPNTKPTFYLSGGMHSGWQQQFIQRYPQFYFLNPCDHGLTDPEEFTEWDLTAIRISQGVIAYHEKDNPSGLGMAFEIGYALGLGKMVIFINEKQDRYAKMIECATHHYFASLEEAFEFLDKEKES